MSSRVNSLQLHSSLPCSKKFCFLTTSTHQHSQFHIWRRPRLKSHNKKMIAVHCHSLNLFNNLLISHSDLIPPTLIALASTLVSLYISRFKSNSIDDEWILFTSPTPFNRFVFLRCPSLAFQGSDLLENVNQKLVTEPRHFVKLLVNQDKEDEEKLLYQRVCLTSDVDGGVISLDWPANLDLRQEHGMDTTLLLVPGTPQGSLDNNIRSFVSQSLKRGCFPIVINPRGCAASPLTTPRLFTAADSDDIYTAIQFISNARPWTTMMAVAWGHGANMLTKYLAEVAERTPLTAATCIDNPFDLDEATRSLPYHIALDKKLTSGLKDILRSNKELFQGRAKGFDVEKALSATSIRDFEREISMLSYGFESIEEFYSKSSTRKLVGSLKVPVLFVQSDDGTVPPFSIPRSSIAENPFASLLLYSPSSGITSEKTAISCWQPFAFEWLAAVELGLLKARHPLLQDVDVTINPSNGLTLVEGRVSDKDGGANKLLDHPQLDVLNGYSGYPLRNVHSGDHSTTNFHLEPGKSTFLSEESQAEDNSSMPKQSISAEAEVKEMENNPVDEDRSQVLQTAQVVMNMLDVSMPGTLAEKQKKKVLTAMEQGETLMKALQGAVPDDVRGKLTASISEIVQNKSTNLNLDRLMKIGQLPKFPSKVKSNTEEISINPSSAAAGHNDVHSSEQMKMGNEMSDITDMKHSGIDMPARDIESDSQPSQKSQKSLDLGQSQSESNQEKSEFSREHQSLGYDENGSVTESKPINHDGSEKATESDHVVDKDRANAGDGVTQVSKNEANAIWKKEEKNLDISTSQDKLISNANTEESLSPIKSSPEPPPIEKESNHFQQGEEQQPLEEQNTQSSTKSEEPAPTKSEEPEPAPTKSEEPAPSPLPTSNSPSISQALDALTGFDDSTQVAVNSVFGVLENMIDQFEEVNGQENNGELDDKENGNPSSAPEASPPVTSETEYISKTKEHSEKEMGSQSDPLPEESPRTSETEFISKTKEHSEKGPGSQSNLVKPSIHLVQSLLEELVASRQAGNNKWDEKQLTQSGVPNSENNGVRSHVNLSNYVDEDKQMIKNLIDPNLSVKNLDKIKHIRKGPLHVTVNPYGDSVYNEYLRQYLLSKMQNTESLDLDSTTCLLLDYFPEDGQWKLLDQSGDSRDSVGNIRTHKSINGRGGPSPAHANTAKIIETSYVVLNTEDEQKPIKEYKAAGPIEISEQDSSRSDELVHFVKNIVLDSLKVEVCRRLGYTHNTQMESGLAQDLEQVAEQVSLAVGHGKEVTWPLESKEYVSDKVGTLNGEHVVKKISSAVKDAVYLRKVLPVGVIVGSVLASLRKHFNVATQHENVQTEATTLSQGYKRGEKLYGQVSDIQNVDKIVSKEGQYSSFENPVGRVEKRPETLNKNTVMVGAVTAALGASALLVHQQGKDTFRFDGGAEVPSGSFNEKVNPHKEHDKSLDAVSEKNQNNIVSSLAEKAMSVAGPVVPTNSDGGVDQERLVAMLADFGQKGGMLRLVGKLALLWGGLRGAMSLTERLITFLRIADRPLFQRIIGFACMVLLLWSPVVIPLFPSLVQSWATHSSTGISVYASIFGLYIAMMILIMIWGKRIRGYKDPFVQYGLDLTSLAKLYDFSKGLMGGVTLVLSIHSIHVLLGYAHFSWPSTLPTSSPDVLVLLKVCGELLKVASRGIATATVVSLAEELIFRSWLPEEIAVDLGYHRAIMISGLAFAMLQRSPGDIPGLWLLSLALSGARERNKGSLSIPIGAHAGIVASSFILKTGRYIIYHPHYPQWVTGVHPLQPFGGAVGLAFCLILAILLYPRKLEWRTVRARQDQPNAS